MKRTVYYQDVIDGINEVMNREIPFLLSLSENQVKRNALPLLSKKTFFIQKITETCALQFCNTFVIKQQK